MFAESLSIAAIRLDQIQRRMVALGVVTVNRLGAAISLKGIELLEVGGTARA